MSERMEGPRDPASVPDPWRDGPRWSDSPAEPKASPGTAIPGGVPPDAGGTATSGEPATCPWCAATTAPGGTTCPSCGAALAQREAIGDLVIPGLTSVEPALQDYASRPLHLTGPSPSHGVASSAIAAAAIGGPAGIAIIGGVAAVAAAEYLGAGRTGAGDRAEHVGEASDAVRQAIERLDRGEELPAADATTPRPELDASHATGAAPAGHAPGAKPATEEDTADGAN